jgi:hypothetical protein
VSHFRSDISQRSVNLVPLDPRARSTMLPLWHPAQQQDGYVSDEGIVEAAELTGTTSDDGPFTLGESECLVDCDKVPCVQINYRYVRITTSATLDAMEGELRGGRLDHDVPSQGTLVRVRHNVGLRAPRQERVEQRAAAGRARAQRVAKEEK